jgi:hypothetical protein
MISIPLFGPCTRIQDTVFRSVTWPMKNEIVSKDEMSEREKLNKAIEYGYHNKGGNVIFPHLNGPNRPNELNRLGHNRTPGFRRSSKEPEMVTSSPTVMAVTLQIMWIRSRTRGIS